MSLMAVDIETYDPNLSTLGDGSCRKINTEDYDGSKMLVAGTYDGTRAKAYRYNSEEWKEFVSLMEDASIDKIFHNGVYDLAWLYCWCDIDVKGMLHDTMTRMVYIDEYADLDLDSCCKKLHVAGKNKNDTIEAWYAEHIEDVRNACIVYGRPFKKTDLLWKHAGFLYDGFAEFRDMMVKYNLQDCIATYNLYHAQESKLSKVMDAYIKDIKLTPLIMRMKKQGTKIDLEALNNLTDTVQKDLDDKEKILKDTYGIDIDMIGSNKKLGERMNAMGIHSPVKTVTGNESWGADALARLMHYPVVPLIVEAKGYKKLLDTYLHGGMRNSIMVGGDSPRIHCTFSPNKREDGGTVTGRFACSKPNLQQIPARDKAVGHSYGQMMRSLFLPEQGCMMAALDYSQIEYLLLAHFAVGKQAEWFRGQAKAGVDFHTAAIEATGIKSRQTVKTFNYGVIYGMGWYTAMLKNYVLFEKEAALANTTIEEYTKNVYAKYHENLPVIRDTMNHVQTIAKLQGYVKTIGGRFQHKPRPQYDPATGKVNDFLYKMLNKLIQGSAADILKEAMLNAYTGGVFDILTLHLTVHDELVVSVPYNKIGAEACAELKRIMEGSYHEQLLVPMKAACELGPDWGYWSSDIWENMQKGIFDAANKCWWSV